MDIPDQESNDRIEIEGALSKEGALNLNAKIEGVIEPFVAAAGALFGPIADVWKNGGQYVDGLIEIKKRYGLAIFEISNLIRVQKKIVELCNLEGIELKALRPPPQSFAARLIEGIVRDDDDDIQQMWARLTVNASLDFDDHEHRVAARILSDLTPVEAKFLFSFYESNSMTLIVVHDSTGLDWKSNTVGKALVPVGKSFREAKLIKRAAVDISQAIDGCTTDWHFPSQLTSFELMMPFERFIRVRDSLVTINCLAQGNFPFLPKITTGSGQNAPDKYIWPFMLTNVGRSLMQCVSQKGDTSTARESDNS